jgi:hypothetical protein
LLRYFLASGLSNSITHVRSFRADIQHFIDYFLPRTLRAVMHERVLQKRSNYGIYTASDLTWKLQWQKAAAARSEVSRS